MKSTTPLRPRRGKPARKKSSALRSKPERDPKYRAWISTLLCEIRYCRRGGRIEAAHMGPHGIAQKASDYTCIPLCYWHHREGPDSAHKLGRTFAIYHRLDIQAIQTALRMLYENERKS